ncbi:MAG: hypothetical protein DRO09_01910 [Thermoprotei archaeon]|nr:MAG: hypothetical protein DRO09_01910 [Thermoprotei archaeon]
MRSLRTYSLNDEDVLNRLLNIYKKVRSSLKERVGRNVTWSEVGEEVSALLDELKSLVIYHVLSRDALTVALRWVRELRRSLTAITRNLNVDGVTFSKEMKSFIEDPRAHLKKKLFIYTHDLIRGSIDIHEYLRVSSAAVRTSLRTNLRTVYQTWVFLNVLSYIGSLGGRLIYPEHRYLNLERMGKQRTGTIPPNAILLIPGRGYLSFFIEAPRPIGWEDTTDLKRAWRLYTALRPDFMVYGGKVMNILKDSDREPIARPDVIIECKELDDWYLRSRDIKGPLTKPLTAEEWRSKWITGLWAGLAEALNIDRSSIPKVVKERRAVRLKEYQVVSLYLKLYKPREMYLVSRSPIPTDIKRYLRDEGINVIDNVRFRTSRLRSIARSILKFAKGSETAILEVGQDVIELINEVRTILSSKGLNMSIDELLLRSLRLLKERVTES